MPVRNVGVGRELWHRNSLSGIVVVSLPTGCHVCRQTRKSFTLCELRRHATIISQFEAGGVNASVHEYGIIASAPIHLRLLRRLSWCSGCAGVRGGGRRSRDGTPGPRRAASSPCFPESSCSR